MTEQMGAKKSARAIRYRLERLAQRPGDKKTGDVARQHAIAAFDRIADGQREGRTAKQVAGEVLVTAKGIWRFAEARDWVHAARVITFLAQMIDLHGRPSAIRCDNGAVLTSQAFTDWGKEQEIDLPFIQPGEPDQNAHIERLNRTYWEEALSAYLFDSLDEVREITAEWLEQHNEIRPHDALGSLPPARYREQLLAAETPV